MDPRCGLRSLRRGWLRTAMSHVGVAALVALLLTLPPATHANPLPAAAVFTHVQQPDPTFCDACPITQCSQIVQYTEATGPVEFDFFVWVPVSDVVVSAQLTLVWPEEWTFIDGGPCNGAVGDLEVDGHQAVLTTTWPDCLTFEDIFLAGRVVLNVTSFGELELPYGASTITYGCPPNQFDWDIDALGGAQAGVVCSYCYQDCSFEMPCEPVLSPDDIALELVRGETAITQIAAQLHGWTPCTADFVSSEPWMQLRTEEVGAGEYAVTLTVDSAGLEPGDYAGWVRGISECVGCAHVSLTVLQSQGIEDEETDGAPPEDVSTWGALKILYR